MSKSCLNYNMMTWDLEVGYMQQRNQTKAPSKGSKTYQFADDHRPPPDERERGMTKSSFP